MVPILLAALVTAVLDILLVSKTPEQLGWYFSSNIKESVKAIERDSKAQDTEDVKFNFLNPKVKAGEEPTETVWNDQAMKEQVQRYLQEHGVDIVVGLETTFDESLTTQVDSWFVTFTLGEANVMTNLSSNTKVVTLSAVKGSYLTGVMAGLQSARVGKKIAMLVKSPPSVRDYAFLQAVHDVSPGTCTTLTAIDMRHTVDTSVNQTVWDRLTTYCNDLLKSNTDVIYTSLGVYNNAVLDCVKKREEIHYTVSTVAGIRAGAVNYTGASLLARPQVDWKSIFNTVLVNPTKTLVDNSSWTAPWADDNKTSSVVSEVMYSGCSDGRSVLQVVKDIETQVTAADLAIGSTELRDDHKCMVHGTSNPSLHNASAVCLPTKGGTVRLVGVGVYVNNIGNVDIKAGSVYMDANVFLHQHTELFMDPLAALQASQGGNCDPSLFQENRWTSYITNTSHASYKTLNFASTDQSKTVTPVKNSEGLISYLRLQAVHTFKPSLLSWPFDTQTVKLVIEDAAESSTDNVSLVFCHLEDYSGMSPNARFFPGLSNEGVGQLWGAEVTFDCWPYLKHPLRYITGQCGGEEDDVRWGEWNLPGAEESCTCLGGTKASSRYAWRLDFVRPVFGTMVKVFLPPITITLVNLGVWLIRPASFTKRLGICGSSLVTTVMFHSSIAAQTPATSQVTTADRFMLIVYWSNFMAFIGVYYQSIMYQAGYEALAESAFEFCRLWGPLSTTISFIGFFFFSSIKALAIWTTATHVISVGLVYCCTPLRTVCHRYVYAFFRRMDNAPKKKPCCLQGAESAQTFIPLSQDSVEMVEWDTDSSTGKDS